MHSKVLVNTTVANNTVGATQADIVRRLKEGIFIEVKFKDVPTGVTGKLAFVGTMSNGSTATLSSASSKLRFINHGNNTTSNFLIIDESLDGASVILEIEDLPITHLTYYLYEASANTIDMSILVKWE
jgi:hypothetical protein